MKALLTLPLLMLLSVKTLACHCEMKPDFRIKEDLAEYQFIAHVKISGIENVTSGTDVHQMNFEVLEQYKGNAINKLLVFGSHPSLKGWTSCDLGEKVGEEWVIFAYYDAHLKQLKTDLCTRSRKTKDINGYQNLEYPNQQTLKKQLQLLFDKVQTEPKYEGKRVENYPNRQKQLEENYVNGTLNGKRTLWFPNGVLQSNQTYFDGKKNGIFEWYAESGNLIKIEKFDSDVRIDTTTV